MTLTLEQALGQKLMLRFSGTEPSAEILDTLKKHHIGGITLFRAFNVDTPAQVRALTKALQAAALAAGQPPLLIGADQEGGQLMTIGAGVTQFAGNLALGAIGSAELTEKVGYAMGQELAAMGVNLNYAPNCDLNSNPANPTVGTRSFGQDTEQVSALTAAMTVGLQKAGIAATAKHFPGHGDTATDSHYGLAVVSQTKEHLQKIELPPFAAALKAGAMLTMMGHIALPKLHDGSGSIPATLSAPVIQKLLREELGFTGVTITDAMDMGAIEQGLGLTIDSIAAAAAGIDLLLLNVDLEHQQNAYAGLIQATQRGLLSQSDMHASAERIINLKAKLAQQPQPSLEVINCAEHQALAQEVADKSITLVRDQTNLLPLNLAYGANVAVIIPQPVNLTPADTSSYITNALPNLLQQRQVNVTEFSVAHHPTEAEIAALRALSANFDLIIVGTLNAYAQAEQAALVNTLDKTDTPLIVVAMRTPYDLQAFPNISTYLCTYSILEPAMNALVKVLYGDIAVQGRLPVSIPK